MQMLVLLQDLQVEAEHGEGCFFEEMPYSVDESAAVSLKQLFLLLERCSC